MNEDVKVEVTMEEREPTAEELDLMAAKQLLMELTMIKKRIYESGTLINGVLVIQVKGIVASLMRKYNEAGMLVGEVVTTKLSDYSKHASVFFQYSPRLKALMKQVVEQLDQVQKKANTPQQETEK
jgi:hypothetical protein